METRTQTEPGTPGNRGNGGQRENANAEQAQGRSGSERRKGGGEQAQQGGGAMQAPQGGQEGAVQTQRERRGVERYNRDAFSMLEQLSNDMYRMFESFAFPRQFSRWQGAPELMTMWSPEIDVCNERDRLRILVDLPGLTKDNVKADVEDGQIVIQGARQNERTEEGRDPRFRRTERRYGSFYRSIPLPDGADPEQARASMKEGVLEITVPMAEKIQGRRLEIQG